MKSDGVESSENMTSKAWNGCTSTDVKNFPSLKDIVIQLHNQIVKLSVGAVVTVEQIDEKVAITNNMIQQQTQQQQLHLMLQHWSFFLC